MPRMTARRTPQLETDRTVQLAPLERPGQAAPNDRSAVESRSPDASTDSWPRKAEAMAASSTRCRSAFDLPAGAEGWARRAALAGHEAGPDDGRQLGSRDRRGPEEPATLANDLPDGPRTGGDDFPAEVLGDGREVAHDGLGRAGELGPQVLALGGDARSGTCRGGIGGPCRSRWRRGPPSRTRIPRPRAGPRQAGPGRSAARRRREGPRGRAGRCAEQDLVDLGQAELPRSTRRA